MRVVEICKPGYFGQTIVIITVKPMVKQTMLSILYLIKPYAQQNTWFIMMRIFSLNKKRKEKMFLA